MLSQSAAKRRNVSAGLIAWPRRAAGAFAPIAQARHTRWPRTANTLEHSPIASAIWANSANMENHIDLPRQVS
jgi:hypothetical protein